MNEKKQNKPNGSEIAADMIHGATAALTYTDEEILATLPDDEVAEFLELRNRVLGEINQDYSDFQESGYTTPLAAEEEEPYK